MKKNEPKNCWHFLKFRYIKNSENAFYLNFSYIYLECISTNSLSCKLWIFLSSILCHNISSTDTKFLHRNLAKEANVANSFFSNVTTNLHSISIRDSLTPWVSRGEFLDGCLIKLPTFNNIFLPTQKTELLIILFFDSMK